MREPRSGKPNCTTTERVYYTNKTTENALISGLLYIIMGILLTKCPPSQMYIIKHTNNIFLLFEYVTYTSLPIRYVTYNYIPIYVPCPKGLFIKLFFFKPTLRRNTASDICNNYTDAKRYKFTSRRVYE